MNNKTIAALSVVLTILGGGIVNASFMPASLMPMQGTTTGWSNTNTTVSTPLNISVVNPVFNDTGGIVSPITASSSAGNATATILETLNDGNGQTWGWIASNDPTGLGVRSNMDYICTMYTFLFGIMQYFQTNSWSC